MNNLCVRCNEQPVKCLKRVLCQGCYNFLYQHGNLDSFPPIVNIAKNSMMEKYGISLVNDLKELVNNHHMTLERIGRKYGITRERIRQLFEILYGFKYTVAVKTKTEDRKREANEKRIAKRDPRYKAANYKRGSLPHKGAESEKKVFDICTSLNYEIKPHGDTSVDLVINGYRVEVKSAYCTCLTSPWGKTPLYHFALRANQSDVDFIICHAVPVNKFFVIPRSEYPEKGQLYLPSIKVREWNTGRSQHIRTSKYYNYLEAWHLLRPKQEEVLFNKPKLVSL